MTALSLMRLIPGWIYALIVAAALAAAGGIYEHHQGAASVQALWDADKTARAIADANAIAERIAQNTVLANQQAADNVAITKVKYNENARTIASLAVRLQRGAGVCAGPASPPDPASVASGDVPSPGPRLFRDDIQRDISEAIEVAEDAAATARACQSFVRDNGMTGNGLPESKIKTHQSY